MNPNRALYVSLVLAAVGAGAMFPLPGLFGTAHAKCAMQTFWALTAALALITAGVLVTEIGPPSRPPRLIDFAVTVLPLALAGLLFLADAPPGLLPGWLVIAVNNAHDAVLAARWWPIELLLAAPALVSISALRRFRRQASGPQALSASALRRQRLGICLMLPPPPDADRKDAP